MTARAGRLNFFPAATQGAGKGGASAPSTIGHFLPNLAGGLGFPASRRLFLWRPTC
jgi:hypothetical protein